MRAPGVIALLAALSGNVFAAQARADLGTFEKESLDEALALRKLELDPSPEGKLIGRIHVVNLDVFSARDGFFPWFNRFHFTTREKMIERESLLAPGDRYDTALAEETSRNLRDPSLSSAVVVVAVKSADADKVDLLIVTRDVWSLRFNSDFEYQQGYLVFLTASLSENNLFGLRKRASLVFDLTQGSASIGPTYVDPNIAGSRLTLNGSVRALFSRQTGAFEGTSARGSLAYPLYALATRWGASIDLRHSDAVVRSFEGTQVRRVDLEETPEADDLPWVYRMRSATVQSQVVRSLGARVIQRVVGGHLLTVNRPSFTDEFPADEAKRQLFAERFFPRSERLSRLYVGYSLFTPWYRVYRDLDTFDLREDIQLGPRFSTTLSQSVVALGSNRSFAGLAVDASYAGAIGDGLWRLASGWSAQRETGAWADRRVSASAYLASPVVAGVVRAVAQARADSSFDQTRTGYFFLGGTNGLRGYAIGDLFGTTQALANVELRTMSLPIRSLRLGGLVFYDVGGAASPDVKGVDVARTFRAVKALVPHHDFGAGLRLLIPHFNTYVLRMDWAFATRSTDYTRAGWPGRFSFGFQQLF